MNTALDYRNFDIALDRAVERDRDRAVERGNEDGSELDYRHNFVIPDGSLFWDVTVLYRGDNDGKVLYLALYFDLLLANCVTDEVLVENVPTAAMTHINLAIHDQERKAIDLAWARTKRVMSAREALEYAEGGE